MSSSYGWPVTPFFRQHPVRGLFGDPRIGRVDDGPIRHEYHFGIDIVAADGTPVYATLTGWVSIHPLHRDTVMVSDATGRVFEYWHVVPALTHGQAIAYSTVIGHVEASWEHVHFAERIGSRYVNPLRPGAMRPYVDRTSPKVVGVTFEQASDPVGDRLSGRIDIVAEAFDVPAVAVPPPWNAIRLAPVLVRWRVAHVGESPGGWHVAFDVRVTLPSEPFTAVYAVGTRSNRTYRVGRYRVYLAHGWDTAAFADGSYVLEIAAIDVRGNACRTRVPFTVANV